ncbi:MAG TPA: hypothetical protein DCL61_27330 [Cyanobacteria bacterium UBA12227]|nr:hypothetical protein [Cyanobacteria bacterium UBA12227]HAX86846.1 hypothetical protein [Cyanobacteria bacterium UBA11370]HBY75525.1 hypothetical protein [Cyanobacteria bacterium UBA11148]
MKVASEQLRYKISGSKLPLAVYREVAAHLRQVDGVKVELIPQTSQKFDYNQSQIEGLWIELANPSDVKSQERVREILVYYQLRQDD